MSFDADEEILQDFLVEAGEILEQLSEQLVELESRPDDMDLLNAIFRGFHTVKGGAGFLQLNALVECCHIAENVFDILRKGERRVSSELMDVVLQALDTVNAMFDQVREQSEPTPATPELLAALARLAEPEGAEPAEPVQAPPAAVPPAEPAAPPEAPAQSASSDITDDEFEQLLDALQGDEAPASAVAEAPAAPAGDEISDAEFEALLDQLHGKGTARQGQVQRRLRGRGGRRGGSQEHRGEESRGETGRSGQGRRRASGGARQARGKRGGDHRAGGYGASRRDHEHGRRAGAGA